MNLEGFTKMDFLYGHRATFVPMLTLNKQIVRFNKICVEKLDYPEYVDIYLTVDGRFAIKGCEQSATKVDANNYIMARSGFKRWIKKFIPQDNGQWEHLCIVGKWDEECGAIIFDTKEVTKIEQ